MLTSVSSFFLISGDVTAYVEIPAPAWTQSVTSADGFHLSE